MLCDYDDFGINTTTLVDPSKPFSSVWRTPTSRIFPLLFANSTKKTLFNYFIFNTANSRTGKQKNDKQPLLAKARQVVRWVVNVVHHFFPAARSGKKKLKPTRIAPPYTITTRSEKKKPKIEALLAKWGWRCGGSSMKCGGSSSSRRGMVVCREWGHPPEWVKVALACANAGGYKG